MGHCSHRQNQRTWPTPRRVEPLHPRQIRSPQKAFMGYERGKGTHGKAVNFGFDKADRAVTVYYFYLFDPEFGAGFVKLSQLLPLPGQGVAQRT
jgi:hypothetical protein